MDRRNECKNSVSKVLLLENIIEVLDETEELPSEELWIGRLGSSCH